MKTAINENRGTYAIEQVLTRVFHPVKKESYTAPLQYEAKSKHAGHSVAHFLWVYVAIFTSIMAAVIIAEKFFFPS